MAESIQSLKKQLRQEIKAKLASLSPQEFSAFNSAIEQRFFELPIIRDSQRIMLYYSIGREVVTAALISKLLKMGKTVALPACTSDKNIRAGIIHDLNELVPGIFGLSEPPVLAPEIDPAALDLIVIPGVAFDREGFRLGHGAGYYDRFLVRTNGYKLGLAYDLQIIDHLPAAPHDVPVHALLTPSKYWVIHTMAK
ncbi:MAG TPA: 5-formyltetrahydrofolate cyclo-ligase [Firmicutes bacterium]|jgi:5-formyltetrahydrofolate cyclo-ligase|nr:5-formyltetrahydrofolate cyclo-ligase [Bacillota bacterium]